MESQALRQWAHSVERGVSPESSWTLGPQGKAEPPHPMKLGFCGLRAVAWSVSFRLTFPPLRLLLSSGLAAMEGPLCTTPAGNGHSGLGSEAPAALGDAEGLEVLAPVRGPAEGEAAQWP